MSKFSESILRRRKALGLRLSDVQKELALRGYDLSLPTVGAWFTGRRRVVDMEQLKALCAVLQTSISEMAGEDPQFAKDPFESALLIESRDLPPANKQLVLALLRSLKTPEA